MKVKAIKTASGAIYSKTSLTSKIKWLFPDGTNVENKPQKVRGRVTPYARNTVWGYKISETEFKVSPEPPKEKVIYYHGYSTVQGEEITMFEDHQKGLHETEAQMKAANESIILKNRIQSIPGMPKVNPFQLTMIANFIIDNFSPKKKK